MNTQKALEILISAVKLANTKGAFSLEDSGLIAQAVAVFTTKPETKKEAEAPVAPVKKIKIP